MYKSVNTKSSAFAVLFFLLWNLVPNSVGIDAEPYSVPVDTHSVILSNSNNKIHLVEKATNAVDKKFNIKLNNLDDIGQGGPNGGLMLHVQNGEFVVTPNAFVTEPLCDTPIDLEETTITFDGERLGGIGISDIRQLNTPNSNLIYYLGACKLIIAVRNGGPKILHLYSTCDDLNLAPNGQGCMDLY